MRESPLDILAEELGIVAGRIEREASLRIDAAIADLRRVDAERELRLTNLERAVADRLALVKVCERGEKGEAGERGLPGEVGRQGEPGERGVQGEPGKLGERGEKGEVGERGLPGEVGRQGEPGERGVQGEPGKLGERGEKGEAGERGLPGLLPIVRAWADAVHYEGQVRSHNGATYQALRDTAKAPPHEDWICIAAAGRDGKDGHSPKVRDTYSSQVDDYRELDIVALGGAAFIARRDNPGVCPGEGWQLIASQGKRGNPGERGAPGPRGDAGPAIVSISVDDHGLLTLINTDGSTVECDLYPLLSKLQR